MKRQRRKLVIYIGEDVYNSIALDAEKLDIPITTMIRAILSNYATVEQTTTVYPTPGSYSINMKDARTTINRYNKMSEILLNQMFSSNMLKCPNCTLPLTEKDFNDNKCSNCGLPIVIKED